MMVFYRSDDGYSLYGQNYQNPYRRQVQPATPANPGGGTRFSGRWDPTSPGYLNELRSGTSKDIRRPPRRGAAAPIPPGLAAQYRDRPYNPYTPNPWVVSPYDYRSNPQNYNQGVNAAEQPNRYLGGYSDDYVSQTTVPMPYGSDNVSMRYFATKDKRIPVYGKPVYREGMEANYPGVARLSVDDIRGWQAFFQMNGFKTGPSGMWTTFEIDAMRHFMTMANGTPGGGMTVEVLRQRVESDLASGAMAAGSLAPSLGSSNLNENAMTGDVPGGAGSAEMMPYTQTTVQTETNEISADQGLLVLMDFWQKRTGRAPTAEEVSRWVKGINAAYRADPSVITTVVTTDPMAGTTDETRTVDETDVDPQADALRASREDVPQGEAQEYGTNRYVDALMQELGI